MRLDGPDLGRMVLCALFGELGDKTFFLTVLLAAWCPWEGIRPSKDCFLQLCFVAAGATMAHVIRVLGVFFILPMPKAWALTVEGCTCALLFAMALKARVDLGRAELQDLKKRLASCSAAAINPFSKSDLLAVHQEPAESDQKWNSAAFSFDRPAWNAEAFGATGPSAGTAWATTSPNGLGSSAAGSTALCEGSYGSVPDIPRSADASHSGEFPRIAASAAAAFFLSGAMVFLTEAEDKSELALWSRYQKAPHMSKADAAIGAMIGFLPTILLQVLLGYLLQRQVKDDRIMFLVFGGFLVLGLITLSQALMHIGVLEPLLTSSGKSYEAIHAK